MKTCSIVFLFSFLVFSFAVNAQKTLTDGTLVYNMSVETGSGEPKMADMLDGATTTIYLKDNKSRSELVSSLGREATIYDATSGKGVILKDYSGQKLMITLTSQDWEENNKKYEGIVFEYKDEYKEIAGYKCQKAIGTMKDGTTINVFFTKDLVANNREFEYAYKSLPGLAMEFETTIGSLKVTYTVSKVNFSIVPATKFELPKSGFRVMTYEESNSAGKSK